MKKILKGFTLIELIIVMAILAILMAAIMNMFKPVRETYVDATLYENQRTSQNGIVTYITESIRYATDLGMYTKDKVTDVEGAVEAFTDAYLEANGVKTTDSDYSAKRTNTLAKMKEQAEVIIIDNDTTYAFSNVGHKGRILRRKFVKNASGTVQPLTNNAEDASTKECRLALGEAYYGESSYTITFDITQDKTGASPTYKGDASKGIKVTVASNASNGIRTNQIISNNGFVLCKNLDAPINGMFDTTKYNSGDTNGNGSATTGDGTKIYIVYTNDTVEITP